MKLLLENWRKYLVEGEAQHFPWLKEIQATNQANTKAKERKLARIKEFENLKANSSKQIEALQTITASLKSELNLPKLNKSKEMDVRIAMAQNKLEELSEDPNIPMEYGVLILQVLTALEQLLGEV